MTKLKNEEEKVSIERLSTMLSMVPPALHKAFWRYMHYARGKKLSKSDYKAALDEFLGVK